MASVKVSRWASSLSDKRATFTDKALTASLSFSIVSRPISVAMLLAPKRHTIILALIL